VLRISPPRPDHRTRRRTDRGIGAGRGSGARRSGEAGELSIQLRRRSPRRRSGQPRGAARRGPGADRGAAAASARIEAARHRKPAGRRVRAVDQICDIPRLDAGRGTGGVETTARDQHATTHQEGTKGRRDGGGWTHSRGLARHGPPGRAGAAGTRRPGPAATLLPGGAATTTGYRARRSVPGAVPRARRRSR